MRSSAEGDRSPGDPAPPIASLLDARVAAFVLGAFGLAIAASIAVAASGGEPNVPSRPIRPARPFAATDP